MPSWVQQGYDEYAKRLPRECALVLKEIPASRRAKNADIARIIKEEGERVLASMIPNSYLVTLDLEGKHWSTQEVSESLLRWQRQGQPIALVVGGADGLDDVIKGKARESWCLSKLTFPHPLVRIIIAEQLYRAWSMLQNHPYHR